jgi:hypothetical protein
MGTGAVSDREAITAALDRFEAAQAELAALSFDALTAPETLAVKDRLAKIERRQGAVDHRLTCQLTSQASSVELGGKSWTDVLSHRLRIGRGAARRSLDEAAELGPRTAMTGEPLQPLLPNVAAAQAAGSIGAEHVRIIRRFFADLPHAVDYETRQACEVDLARIAAEHTPDALRKAADRLMALVHPDGDFSDIDRARRRHLIIGKQQADGMSKISGLLDPEARASFEAVLTKLAAPGMCNPDDENPWTARPARRTSTMINARPPNATTTRSIRGANCVSRRGLIPNHSAASAAAAPTARLRPDAPSGPPRFASTFDHLMVASLHPHHHPGHSRDDREANNKNQDGRHNTPPSLC